MLHGDTQDPGQIYGLNPTRLHSIGGFKGIFDDVAGAVVGYSIGRWLSSMFSGALVRVRRSIDDAELDINALSNGNLDIPSLDAFCAGTDGFDVKIYDQSGNADDVIQATASKQAQGCSGGTTIVDVNGNPISRFDGVDDTMQAASVALDSYFSIYVVGKFTLAKPMFIEQSVDANSNDGFFFFGSDNHAWVIHRTTVHRAGIEVNWMGSALAQVTFIYEGTGAYYLNGSVQANSGEMGSDVGDSSTTDALNLFSRNQASVFSDGDFYELLIFDGAHNTATQQLIEANQKAKYSTP